MAESHELYDVARPRACIYCGCTDDRACVVSLSDFDSPEIRAATSRFLDSCGVLGLVPDVTINCWWISHDPPVCSAPAFQRRFTAARLFDQITSPPAEQVDGSRDVVGQGTV